ncbi:Fic family protein [Pedobacter sp. SD-b]|uniref:Fic family protein n=1 Tax=Pedobacter segetis TaxID=2793069 RepID=A0ABS1BLT6_9SPHI|nr:Fic family protein [Pedobacter segetis]MBK0383768.1 Fic family protein [Pedobacter segetis]
MKPPYQITSEILRLITSVSIKLGEVKANYLSKTSPQLRKQNKIKTIHSSLSLEGNTLSQEQISAIIDDQFVLAPKKDILEVKNAIEVYDQINKFKSVSSKSFLRAHQILMKGLIDNAGNYRNKSVGISKGEQITHIAPPHQNVPYLMKDLFNYLKSEDELTLIKSCVFHYEMEFIHPFLDGNGRMGRLWQTLILMEEFPVFEFLSFETLIYKNQDDYYKSLSLSDREGNSTLFISFMLDIIDQSLKELLSYKNRTLNDLQRISYFLDLGNKEFSRKDYMNVFKDISTATASRDLLKAIGLKKIRKIGSRNLSKYLAIDQS